MSHVALLGDSVIDNKAYISGGPDVAGQLRTIVPIDWQVTRLATDGTLTSGVLRQLEIIPKDATHMVISAGGNDALGASSLLDAPASSVGNALLKLTAVQDSFRVGYSRMLDAALRLNIPVALCTIYDPRFPEPVRRRVASLGLSIFNDVITRLAFSRGITVLDLRLLFNDDNDFANPIEPAIQGGIKLARAIHQFAMSYGQIPVIH